LAETSMRLGLLAATAALIGASATTLPAAAREDAEDAQAPPPAAGRVENAEQEDEGIWEITVQRRARAAFLAGEHEKAIAGLTRIVEKDLAILPTYYLRGLANFARGKFEEAAADFEFENDVDDWGIEPRVWAHIARLRAGASNEALATYLVENPEMVRPAWMEPVAKLLLAKGSAEACEKALATAQEKAENADARARLGAVVNLYLAEWHLCGGRTKEAGRLLEKAATYDGRPDSYWPLVGKGGLAQQELARLREPRAIP